jgi:tyrosyl-tRNA synthetase
VRVFQEQGKPDEMEQYKLRQGESVLDVLENSGLVDSRSQARRLIGQHAVRLDDRILEDPHTEFPGKGILQVGKRRFIRII